MTRIIKSRRLAVSAFVLVLCAGPRPRPGSRADAVARAAQDRRHRLRRRVLRLQLQQGRSRSLRTFDVQHNTFSLSLAEIAFAKGVTPESRVGFRADLDFGKTADLVAAFEPEADGKEIYKHIQQAYVSLLTGKVQWDVGKFVTPIGAEVIESQDNWNYTPLDPVRLRDPVLPRGRARHAARDRQAHRSPATW